MKKKFNFFVAVPQRDNLKIPFRSKKKFASLENGCIFALAFDGKTERLKSGRERQYIETFETRDSVCRKPCCGEAEDTNESKVKRKILTMKSLILAQDER